jgi:predicted enzyme related to lactoylglutathione lyase
MPEKLVHFELPAADVGRATAFWSGVFGWDFGDSDVTEFPYLMTRTGEDQGGAIYKPEQDRPGLLANFDTDDIEDTIRKVRAGGGEASEKMPIPHVGWFAHCTDTEGNTFGVFQSEESAGA